MSVRRSAWLALIYCACPGVEAFAAPSSIDAAALQLMIHESLAATGIPGLAIAVVGPAGPGYVEGFGKRAVDDAARVDADTLFKLNSLTKSIMATAIAVEVDRGVVSWNDRMIDLDPGFHLADAWVTREATLEDALSHRIGVEATDWMGDLPGLELAEAIHRLRYLPQKGRFRAQFIYDNFMFSAGAVAVGRRAGDWRAILSRDLFEPLGMRSATTEFESNVRAEELAPCNACELDHAPRGLTALRQPLNVAAPHVIVDARPRLIHWQLSNAGPAGGVWSSVRDLVPFLQLFLNEGRFAGKPMLTPATVRRLAMPSIYRTDRKPADATRGGEYARRAAQFGWSYGLGWEISQYAGHRMLHNAGRSLGYRSQMIILPDDGVAVAIFANFGDGAIDLPRMLALDIVDRQLKLSRVEWTRGELKVFAQSAHERIVIPDTPPVSDASCYLGSYVHPAYGTLNVTQDEHGTLHADQGATRFGVLHPIGHSTFQLFWNGPRRGPDVVGFLFDASGQAASLQIREQRFARAPTSGVARTP